MTFGFIKRNKEKKLQRERDAADKLAADAALAAARATYESSKRALEAGDLALVPARAPRRLGTSHAAVQAAKAALLSRPVTLADYTAATLALQALRSAVRAYIKADTSKKNVDEGLRTFGSGGSKLDQLAGHDKLNALQKRLLDKALKKQLRSADHVLSEPELKAIAQRRVRKVNQLAQTPLGGSIAGLDDNVAKSDSLKNNIIKLQRAGWRITASTPGSGSSCDKGSRTIVVDPSESMDTCLGTLAHEAGHALFTPPAKPTPASAASAADYLKRCLEVDFIDEGEAQMNACRAVKQLQANSVGAAVPADSGDFMAIYDQFVAGSITEDAARKAMAMKFGNLVTSTTHESYLAYYGNFHIDDWNAAQTDASRHVSNAILGSIVLFS